MTIGTTTTVNKGMAMRRAIGITATRIKVLSLKVEEMAMRMAIRAGAAKINKGMAI